MKGSTIMKKLFALSLSCLTIMTCFVGCGDDDDDGSKKSGPDAAIEAFAKACTSKNGGKNYYTYQYPESYIKELKEDDEWEDMINDYNDDLADYLEDCKITVKDVKKGDKFDDDTLKSAESYFESRYDADVKITEGYEYKVKIQYEEDGEKETQTELICAVKLKDDGWKVINDDADYISSYY